MVRWKGVSIRSSWPMHSSFLKMFSCSSSSYMLIFWFHMCVGGKTLVLVAAGGQSSLHWAGSCCLTCSFGLLPLKKKKKKTTPQYLIKQDRTVLSWFYGYSLLGSEDATVAKVDKSRDNYKDMIQLKLKYNQSKNGLILAIRELEWRTGPVRGYLKFLLLECVLLEHVLQHKW